MVLALAPVNPMDLALVSDSVALAWVEQVEPAQPLRAATTMHQEPVQMVLSFQAELRAATTAVEPLASMQTLPEWDQPKILPLVAMARLMSVIWQCLMEPVSLRHLLVTSTPVLLQTQKARMFRPARAATLQQIRDKLWRQPEKVR